MRQYLQRRTKRQKFLLPGGEYLLGGCAALPARRIICWYLGTASRADIQIAASVLSSTQHFRDLGLPWGYSDDAATELSPGIAKVILA
jgi:hypothetical protein